MGFQIEVPFTFISLNLLIRVHTNGESSLQGVKGGVAQVVDGSHLMYLLFKSLNICSLDLDLCHSLFACALPCNVLSAALTCCLLGFVRTNGAWMDYIQPLTMWSTRVK